MQASQNMQSTKKKHRKSGTPNKLREKVEVSSVCDGEMECTMLDTLIGQKFV